MGLDPSEICLHGLASNGSEESAFMPQLCAASSGSKVPTAGRAVTTANNQLTASCDRHCEDPMHREGMPLQPLLVGISICDFEPRLKKSTSRTAVISTFSRQMTTVCESLLLRETSQLQCINTDHEFCAELYSWDLFLF